MLTMALLVVWRLWFGTNVGHGLARLWFGTNVGHGLASGVEAMVWY